MAIKPFIFTACDLNYYETYAEALYNSITANGHKCEIYCSGKRAESNQSKIYHTQFRFHLLPQRLEKHGSVLLIDTDSIMRKPVTVEEEYDIGLFVEDRPDIERQVKGGCVYTTPAVIPLVNKLKERLDFRGWFDEQSALHHLFLKSDYKIKRFDESVLSWNFSPGAAIWTGKGDRKFDRTFMEEVDRWRKPTPLSPRSRNEGTTLTAEFS